MAEFVPYEELSQDQKLLVGSDDLEDRVTAAERGWGLDQLKTDQEWEVREAVARQGHALDELKSDPAPWVRAAVARQGYALDKLKDDPSSLVRQAVAEQGYALEQLKSDPDWGVRAAVARQGHALEELKYDPDRWVRVEVDSYLITHRLTLEEWIAQNPDEPGKTASRDAEVARRVGEMPQRIVRHMAVPPVPTANPPDPESLDASIKGATKSADAQAKRAPAAEAPNRSRTQTI